MWSYYRNLSSVLFPNIKPNDDNVSFFRDVFMEKHWRSVINKSICDYFFEAQSKVSHVYSLDTPCSVCVCLYMCFLNHTGDSWWLKISLRMYFICTPAWRVDLTRLCLPKLFRVVNSWEKHSCRQIFVFILFYHTFVSVKFYFFFFRHLIQKIFPQSSQHPITTSSTLSVTTCIL